MQNRRERRAMERQLGLLKAEKSMTADQRAAIKQRKKEYIKQMLLQRAQEAENRRINEEAEAWSAHLEKLMASGMTREAAEGLLKNNLEVQKKREEKLAARKSRREA